MNTRHACFIHDDEAKALVSLWRDYMDYADADEDKATRKMRQKMGRLVHLFIDGNNLWRMEDKK